MAAVDYVEPENASAELGPTYGALAARHGYVRNLYKALARQPELLGAVFGLEAALGRTSVDPRFRELASLAACEANDCEYDRSYRHAAARRAGLSERQVQDLDQPDESDAYDAAERLVIRFAVVATRCGRIEGELAAELRRQFSETQLVELAAAVAQADLTSRLCLGLKIELP
jgi:AhpD family alkylhydroperoxidase